MSGDSGDEAEMSGDSGDEQIAEMSGDEWIAEMRRRDEVEMSDVERR